MKTNAIEYLNEIVSKYPNNIAYEEIERTITFGETQKAALNISTNISSSNIGIRQIIAIFLPKSINAILSMFGILYSGNTYMPLDVKSPKERLDKILDNVKPIAIITDNEHLNSLKTLNVSFKVLLIEDLFKETDDKKTFYQYLQDTDLIYILNTSGSTGIPKAVGIPHRGVIDYINWFSKHYNITNEDVIAGQAQLFFDVSVTDIYTPLKTGCKYVIVPDQNFVFPIRLLEYLQKKKATVLNFIPVSLVNVANLDLLTKCKPESIEKVLFTGDVMPVKQLNYWIDKYPNVLFSNMYGPTEATVEALWYDVNRKLKDDESIPIGFPCHNIRILLLNEDNYEVTKPYEDGEICIKGSCLALGYYNNPKATAEHFVQNPLNKNYPEIIYRTGDIAYYNGNKELIYKGRKDFQIKHLGHRIELSEIDTAFSGFVKFSNVCCLYDNENREIVLFYEAKEEISLKDIIVFAKEKLPKYMIPTKYIKINEFPRNQNGKIDRKILQKQLALSKE